MFKETNNFIDFFIIRIKKKKLVRYRHLALIILFLVEFRLDVIKHLSVMSY